MHGDASDVVGSRESRVGGVIVSVVSGSGSGSGKMSGHDACSVHKDTIEVIGGMEGAVRVIGIDPGSHSGTTFMHGGNKHSHRDTRQQV